MPTARSSFGNKIYQIKVTLLWSSPPIWRRLLVPSDITLSDLHNLLQRVMGWDDSHLHEFHCRGQCYGPTDPEQDGPDKIDECKVRLNQLLVRTGAKISYTYDFGDDWKHAIVLEQCLPVDPNATYPECTGGARACPPEDCGGMGGYYDLLKAIRDPQHPRHEEVLEWMDADYDPEEFSIEEINRVLPGRRTRVSVKARRKKV
jgi:Plasmid pRiA4b ORF-3-like protein